MSRRHSTRQWLRSDANTNSVGLSPVDSRSFRNERGVTVTSEQAVSGLDSHYESRNSYLVCSKSENFSRTPKIFLTLTSLLFRKNGLGSYRHKGSLDFM